MTRKKTWAHLEGQMVLTGRGRNGEGGGKEKMLSRRSCMKTLKKKKKLKDIAMSGAVAHAFDLSTQEAETDGSP